MPVPYTKILVTGASILPELLGPLRETGYEVVAPDRTLHEEELIQELSDTTVYLYGGDEEVTAKAIGSASALKLIAFYGVGYESFLPMQAVRDHNVRISNTPGTHDTSVAEFTIGHLLNARRKLTAYAISYMEGVSGHEEKQSDLGGHSVGIIGLGGVGTRIAEILTRGFNANVSYYSRTRKPAVEDDLGITYRGLNDLFACSESVIVMIPGNERTFGLISAEQLALMSPGSVLVNTARPGIVDPAGLLEHLKAGTIEVAAFDGFYNDDIEGVAELKSLQPDRLIVTGHIASLTHEARNAMTRRAVRSILNFLSSGTDPCIVA